VPFITGGGPRFEKKSLKPAKKKIEYMLCSAAGLIAWKCACANLRLLFFPVHGIP
jgi:hypothetical protein